MEQKNEVELTDVTVDSCRESNAKEVRLPSVKMPISEKRRSASVGEFDDSPHSSPREASPRSSATLHKKRRSVSESDLSSLDQNEFDPDDLGEKAAHFSVGAEHPKFNDVRQLCSEEFAKMSSKSKPPSPQKTQSRLLRKKRSQAAEDDSAQQVSPVDHEFLRSFNWIDGGTHSCELDKRSSLPVDVPGWMITKAFDSRNRAIEAEREAALEKEKTTRMKNILVSLVGGGGVFTTSLAIILTYVASKGQCDPCDVCEVCEAFVNATIGS